MPKDNEYGTKIRLLRVMRALIDRPNSYTKHQLADQYGVHVDTISGDIESLRNAGFGLEPDAKGRWAFVVDKPIKKVQDLLYFSEEERVMLHQAIDSLHASPEKQQRLKQKLHALYDYSRLGHSFLRKPYLGKVDLLEQAKSDKKQVVLEGYRSSNSNTVADRTVEPYHISPAEDTLQSYDVDKQMPRHFRISRIQRVRLLDADWQFEGSHNILRTDPFRIVDNNQVNVHLRLSVGAYNELVERYPVTRSFILETEDPNYFDFQCMVNHRFFGLTNFILGFHHLEIQVLTPDSLRDHLLREISSIKF